MRVTDKRTDVMLNKTDPHIRNMRTERRSAHVMDVNVKGERRNDGVVDAEGGMT